MPKEPLQVFEHEILKPSQNGEFQDHHLKALQKFHGDKGVPYFNLIHNGVKFTEFVGVLQVGKLTIEVLPKIDKEDKDKFIWHDILISMLKSVGLLKVHATSNASLRLQSNSILDLYFELFLLECEQLFHKGLIKKYRKTEGNNNTLKGQLQFDKHITKNVVHKERFYVRYTVYDREHPLNQVLYKTLKLLRQINTSTLLEGRINSMLLSFPEIPDVAVSDAFFDKISYNRKSEAYRTAIDIARLLLLNYHPDVRSGRDHVLALMFDMNKLWEAYVFKMLKKEEKTGIIIKGQAQKDFWKPENSYARQIRPDIVIEFENKFTTVIDTKWKIPYDMRPADDDLKQMFVYNQYFNAEKSILLYPGKKNSFEHSGNYSNHNHSCGVWRSNILDEEKKKLNKDLGKLLLENINMIAKSVTKKNYK